MFQALKKHPVLGTSLVLVNVINEKVLPVYDQCPLQIHKVHHFEYHEDEVVVRHHNEIDGIGVWRTSNASVSSWTKANDFKSTAPIIKGTFKNQKDLRTNAGTKKGLGKRKRVRRAFFCANSPIHSVD
jgi:hypothetical protein